jgi:hypothetical protein
MSPSAPELSVYRGRKGGGRDEGWRDLLGDHGKKWRWRSGGIVAGEVGRGAPGPFEAGRKSPEDHVILQSSVIKKKGRGEHVIFWDQKECGQSPEIMWSCDLQWTRRKDAENRWSSEIRNKEAENKWSSEIKKKERGERCLSEIRKKNCREQVIFRKQEERTRRTGVLPRSGRKNTENRWSFEIRKKEGGEQVIFRDQEERRRRTGNLPRSGRKNKEKRWSSKIRKMERGEQVIFRE